ncbi:MAG: (2Fe-2S)-binding protein [Melioribacteraceae bacterium]|nr:(2Fe-2S)-binding protein [Melioribacteraceae bacterium]MCF8353719.1 (2Fe-2S)-binding protein [Melioribacteraceae bacterium]MCF8394972.1 (2Fe-2S)-binding protein [Melioribacteraceae bacterium]MCF8418635.1 (2Fe-2S)-binding protein [Melioribacteraceae bacterium]
MKITFKLNGENVSIEVESYKRLIDMLREDFELTGTKEGCSIGECGACTVLMDGKAVNSCLVLAAQIDGAEILTIEGVNQGNNLSDLQRNFLTHGAVQCGFCTPGMILSSLALLNENPNPTVEEIEESIAGNLCRCTGYKQIIEAVKATAEMSNQKLRNQSA